MVPLIATQFPPSRYPLTRNIEDKTVIAINPHTLTLIKDSTIFTNAASQNLNEKNLESASNFNRAFTARFSNDERTQYTR